MWSERKNFRRVEAKLKKKKEKRNQKAKFENMKKVLVELTYEEAKTLEMLLEIIEYISQHGSLPHVNNLQSATSFPWVSVAGVEESELKAHQKVGLAQLRELREKLKKASERN
jgi:hypothetical protein